MAGVTFETQGAVAVVTLDRAEKMNAISVSMIRAMHARMQEVEARDDIKAVILTGAGKAFCTGKDLEDEADLTDRAALEESVGQLQDITRMIVESGKIYIAAVNGWAVGAGFEIALNCDLSIWAEGARAFMPELKWGLYPSGGSTAAIPRRAGAYATFEMLLLQEKLPARRLQEMGMAWRVVPDDLLMDEAQAVAEQVAGLPAARVADLKRAVNRALYGDLGAVLADETRALVDALMDPETAERMKQFGG
ncbi:enoyl-CoA hydratase/isomerase family protein [Marimonas lutisalis]|uniref:enoyl-CoA hydratase/isomerase family protein n=1 Tax=Marimonas lutisalis TaxID=2545756 RepID=UPI0010F6C59C|nr:enoyl-CoA hydratase/isomerase family protein [Marimonas lutisalis]